MPATLQVPLLARLDRLGPAAREVAQAGGAIGREFTYDLLVSAAPRAEAETRNALDQLVSAGLVFQHGVPPAATYQFKHALVQDTAYGTLLRGPRQALHGRIAEAIEKRTPERAEREAEVLAHHFAEAGQPERTATYCWLRRVPGVLNVEAIAHLCRGIQALARGPKSGAFAVGVGAVVCRPALMGARDTRVRGRGLSARTKRRALGDDVICGGLGRLAVTDQAQRLSRSPCRRAVGRPSAWAIPASPASTSCRLADLFLPAIHALPRSYPRGLAYDREKHGTTPCSTADTTGGVRRRQYTSAMMLGYPDQAVEDPPEHGLGKRPAHMPSVGHAFFAACVHMMRRDVSTALDFGERLVALGREHGLAQPQAVGKIARGWALAQLSEPREVLAELRAAVNAYKSSALSYLSFFLVVLAETELRGGYIDRADATLADVIPDRLTISTRRWDPFYATLHQVVTKPSAPTASIPTKIMPG